MGEVMREINVQMRGALYPNVDTSVSLSAGSSVSVSVGALALAL